MAEKKAITGQVKIPARLSYVFLAAPQEPKDGNGDPKYKVECRIPKSDETTLKKIRKAIKEACIDKFGEEPKKWPPSFRKEGFFAEHLSVDGKDGFFLRDGAYKDDDSYAEEVFFNTTNKRRPRVGFKVGTKWKEIKDTDEIREKIYSGCYADVVIQAYGYDTNGSKGVAASLQAVVFTKDGERLGGASVNMEDMFGEEATDEEVMAEEDDLDNI